LQLANRLEQKRVARDCAEWISQKVQIKSIRHAQLLHGKMYHIANAGVEEAILGSSNFTVRGLGLGAGNNNIELNLVVDSNRDRQDLKAWFDELWKNDGTCGTENLVEDVKAEVLRYLGQLYQNHAPEFIYYKTLFHIFEKYIPAQQQSIVALVDQILTVKRSNPNSDVSTLERKIDTKINRLYGLAPEEIKIVEGAAK
jgi:phosphatidylserine/phosphatidylglycerophosphate/cardiolipin synthase-like enzyme